MTTDAPAPSEQRRIVLTSLFVGGHLATVVIALEIQRHGHDWTGFAITGLTAAQVNLAALWVGVGRANVLYRWGALAGVIAGWIYLSYSPERGYTSYVYSLPWQGAAVILMVQAARFLGARLVHRTDSDLAEAPEQAQSNILPDSSRARLDLAQLFAVVSSIACMAAATALRGQPVTLQSLWLDVVWYRGPVATIGVASAWAVLAEGRWTRRVLLILFCSAVVGGAQWAVIAWDAYDWWIYAYRGGGYALNALIVCLSLGTFRAAGYRIAGV